MTVAAKEANGQTNEIRPTSATSSTANGFRSNNAKNAYTSNPDSNIMTREAYKASQKNKLPQTGNANESGLVALGLVLAATTVSLFGLKKREN